MKDDSLNIGSAVMTSSAPRPRGDWIKIGATDFYRIADYDRMDPFFLSVVSSSDHWMFISSDGGLTAGRRNSDNALFPYYTEDKIRDGSDHTGSRTILRVTRNGKRFLWEPFSRHCAGIYEISRNLYKNVAGNMLIFEEVNHDLDLTFSYTWLSSETFGFVKRSELENTSEEPVSVESLDGIENILPWGMEEFFQNHFSCLGDAYKDNSLSSRTGLATYSFSSIPGDSAEPAEALRATVCWSTCQPEATRLLSSLQLEAFRRGGEVRSESRVCGRRGAYFVRVNRELGPGAREEWLIIADLEYGLCEITALEKTLAGGGNLADRVLDDVEKGTRSLTSIVARADGLQKTGDRLGSAHHFSNVLFNVMRGGIFESSYSIPVADLTASVRAFNRDAWTRHERFLKDLGNEVELGQLIGKARSTSDPVLLRLVFEYLPISFSRRHGDPSRPWNKFSINVRHRDGSRILDYQGNWRDIFQNWEALCLSFPEYLESVITRFLNTTTADGYNPYRVTKQGYDWEIPNPGEPWANFGYWGDHQIIYLLKFLEASRMHHPGALETLLRDRRFVYADVPYDIKPYANLLEDPRDSVEYNVGRADRIAARVEKTGFDGRYLTNLSNEICRANLTEKLLVPLLAKIGNFVPGAGFWMNTQRPEWNDANNALAGYGVSMVTLYYARRYGSFILDLLDTTEGGDVQLGEEVATWLEATSRVLTDNSQLLDAIDIENLERKVILDGLGRAADDYRRDLYANGLSGRERAVAVDEIISFLRLVLDYFDQTIRLNKRDGGLFHAYNVLEIAEEGIAIERLNPMLEGQVAVLSSGALDPAESLAVLEALRQSEMYRPDQHSYLLYPDRALPSFFEKNTIPSELADRSRLLTKLAEDGDTELVERDGDGRLHFNGLFKNIRDVRTALDQLERRGYGDLVHQESGLVAEIFEAVFEHKKFTGRSGTFYGYEGLGCIYWHMVSKLLLATQEACRAAAAEDSELFSELARRYYDVRAGLGFNKSPHEYGAFPTDPYSHTPGFAGARQPGMTGQVKEEIITRFGELGVSVQEGRVRFDPLLLRRSEFLDNGDSFEYFDADGRTRTLSLDAETLAFTYCQIPVVYRLSAKQTLTLYFSDGTIRNIEGLVVDEESSREIFTRSGRIERIEATLTPGLENGPDRQAGIRSEAVEA